MKSVKLYQSKNYLFQFRIDATDEQIVEYANQVERRRLDILKLLGCERDIVCKKPIYIIEKSENENMQSGKGNAQCIHLFVSELQDLSKNKNLVIHEETHFLLFNMYPEISVFLNEGIAEYICWRYTKNAIPEEFEKSMKYIQEITSDMVLSNENWLKSYSSQGIWIYGIAYLYMECMLSDRHTVIDMLNEIYVRKQTSIISKTLQSCQEKYKER